METIVAISGTSRPGNFTSRALAFAVGELEKKGRKVTLWDAFGKELGFPGEPETDDARALQSLVRGASAVILATPEYHGSFSAMTKLILENMGFPSALKGKPIALLGVAQGRIGAIKSIEQLRSVCSHMGGLVLPTAVSIAGVQNAFDPSGALKDPGTIASLTMVGDSLLEFMKTYVCPKMELEAIVRSGRVEPFSSVV